MVSFWKGVEGGNLFLSPKERGFPLTLLFITTLNLLLYHKALSLFFIQDDFMLLKDVEVEGARGFLSLWAKSQANLYRPLSTYVYFYSLRGLFGLNPMGYHAANLLFHILNSLLVYLLVAQMTKSPLAGFISSLFFLSRGAHLASIYWICSFTQPSTLFFLLLAFLCFLKHGEGRRWPFFFLSHLFFTLALLCNFNAVVFPFILLSYRLLWPKRLPLKKALSEGKGFFLLLVLYFSLYLFWLGLPGQDPYYSMALDKGALKNLLYYSLVTSNLLHALIYWDVGWALFGFVLLVMAILFLMVVFQKPLQGLFQREEALFPCFFLATAWHFLGLVPYISLKSHFFPHYMSLSSVGASLFVGMFLSKAFGKRSISLALASMLLVAFFSIRFLEAREADPAFKGLIYKSEVARNSIHDLREMLKGRDDVGIIAMRDVPQEIVWIYYHGRAAEMFLDKPYPVRFTYVPERNDVLVVGFKDMHLYEETGYRGEETFLKKGFLPPAPLPSKNFLPCFCRGVIL